MGLYISDREEGEKDQESSGRDRYWMLTEKKNVCSTPLAFLFGSGRDPT
jgi:hypothetical protein